MREATVNRPTKETNITVHLNIDGSGKSKINSGIGFMDHMLELFAFWGSFDLDVTTNAADLKVDIHHTNEDLGIVLGQVFKKALADKSGITRISDASAPMENVTANIVVDISGRGSLRLSLGPGGHEDPLDQEGYEFKYLEHFLEAFAKQLGMNLIVKLDNPNMYAS